MLGSFNFLENIREEDDGDLEEEIDFDDVVDVLEETSYDEMDLAASGPDGNDASMTVAVTDEQKDKEQVMSRCTCLSEAGETSFGSIDHTTIQSLSDASSSCHEKKVVVVVPRSVLKSPVADKIDSSCCRSWASNSMPRQQSSWKVRATQSSIWSRRNGVDQRTWSPSGSFLGRVLRPSRHQKNDEETANKKFSTVNRQSTASPTPNTNPITNVRQLFLDTLESWKTTTTTTMTKSTSSQHQKQQQLQQQHQQQRFQPTRTTIKDSTIKLTFHRERHRRTPSGSFASAIGRGD
jgi:hypothetical protein